MRRRGGRRPGRAAGGGRDAARRARRADLRAHPRADDDRAAGQRRRERGDPHPRGLRAAGRARPRLRPDRARPPRADRLLPAPPRERPVHRHVAHLGAGTPSDAVQRHWQDIMDAYEAALADARPGVEDLYGRACDVLESRGHPTQRRPGEGLEKPAAASASRSATASGSRYTRRRRSARRPDPLFEGDTIAIEPSLGYDGRRVRDGRGDGARSRRTAAATCSTRCRSSCACPAPEPSRGSSG